MKGHKEWLAEMSTSAFQKMPHSTDARTPMGPGENIHEASPAVLCL
jgi:hypothetical protein